MSTNDTTISVENRGLYLARFHVSYKQGPEPRVLSSPNFPINSEQSITIPSDAREIEVVAEFRGLFAWYRIDQATMPKPESRRYQLRGAATRKSAHWERLDEGPVQGPKPAIDHVIVIMMENRSFDHLLGFLGHLPEPLRPGQYPLHESSTSGPVGVSPDAAFQVTSPDHSHQGVMQQLFGDGAKDFPKDFRPTKGPDEQWHPQNKGFVRNYSFKKRPHSSSSFDVMRCFDPQKIPVIAGLAKQYAVCTRWFCSVPGETWPNRDYALAGTSFGLVDNHYPSGSQRWNANTITKALDRCKRSWKIYYKDLVPSMAYYSNDLGTVFQRFRGHHDLLLDIKYHGKRHDGKDRRLPHFSWVEPDHGLTDAGNSHHPQLAPTAKEFIAGEALIASIHNALLETMKDAERPEDSLYARTLFVLTYDEHGGFFDHEPPPSAVPPDGKTYKDGDYEFKFDLLGPRVPAVLMSPWIKEGLLISDVFDHTSIAATLREVFGIDVSGQRAEAAKPFWRTNDSGWYETTIRNDLHPVEPLPLPPVAQDGPAPEPTLDDSAVKLLELADEIERNLDERSGERTAPFVASALSSVTERRARLDRVLSKLHAAAKRIVEITDAAGYVTMEIEAGPRDADLDFTKLSELGAIDMLDDEGRRLVLRPAASTVTFTEGETTKLIRQDLDKRTMGGLFDAFRENRLDVVRAGLR